MIVFLAHPVAPLPSDIDLVLEDLSSHGLLAQLTDARRFAARTVVRRNVENALGWLNFLVRHTPWVIAAPWIPYVLTLDDTSEIERNVGMAASRVFATASEAVVLCGGRMSSGMVGDETACPGPSISLLDIGTRAPVAPYDPPSVRWREDLQLRWATRAGT